MTSVPNRRHVPFFTALVVMILAGQGGAMLSNLLLSGSGKSANSADDKLNKLMTSLEDNFKVQCAVMAWLLVNYVFSKHVVYDYIFPLLDKAPFNFIYYIPHDWRRGIALCSMIHKYKKQSRYDSWQEYCGYSLDYSILIPLVLSTMSSCSSTITLATLRSRILLNREERKSSFKSKPIFSTILYKLQCRLFCALIYNVVVFEMGIQKIVLWHGALQVDTKVIIGMIFAILPVYHYLEELWQQCNNNFNNVVVVVDTTVEQKYQQPAGHPAVKTAEDACCYELETTLPSQQQQQHQEQTQVPPLGDNVLLLTIDIQQEELNMLTLIGHASFIPTVKG